MTATITNRADETPAILVSIQRWESEGGATSFAAPGALTAPGSHPRQDAAADRS